MDEENSVEFISEADDEQAAMLDKLTGKKIWNVELIEDPDADQSMIRIFFSPEEDDYLMIHCEAASLYLVEPKPKALH
jgi:hypothetical protein|tara:strand:- start:148 stop:381 length:234 start_codon:yes stop_codon:yes gene_type:complete